MYINDHPKKERYRSIYEYTNLNIGINKNVHRLP